MRRAELWAALVVFIGLAGIVTAGCQSEPPGTAANEAANQAAGVSAGGAAAEATAEPASEPSATEPASEPSAGDSAAQANEPARITPEQLLEVFKDSNVFLLDVRGPEEIEEVGTVEGYTNIPIEELEARLDELPRDRPILTA